MKKILLSLSALLMAGAAWAQAPTERLTATELLSVQTTHRFTLKNVHSSHPNKYFNGTTTVDWNDQNLSDYIYEWVKVGDGAYSENAYYIKKSGVVSEESAYMGLNGTSISWVAKSAAAQVTAIQPTKTGTNETKFDGSNALNGETDAANWLRICTLNEDGNPNKTFRVYGNGATVDFPGTGTNGVWTVFNAMDLSDYYKVTFTIKKDDATETVIKFGKTGDVVESPDYVGYDADMTSVTIGSSDQEVTVNYTINPRSQLQALCDLAENIEGGEDVGDYTVESAMTLYVAYGTAEVKLADTETEITDDDVAALKSALDALEIVQPESGKLYRIKSKTSSKYITTPANGNTGTAMVLEATTSNRNVIYLEGSNLLCFGTGYYINDANHAKYNWKGTYTFEPSKTYSSGYVSIKVGSNYFSATSTSASLALAAVDQVDALDWKIEEVTFLPVPVNEEAGYATLYAPVALNNSYTTTKRVAAYTGVINGDVLSLTSVDEDGVIPANTPVVLEYLADIQSDGCVYLEVSSSTKAAVESDLKGTFKSSYIEGASYVLAMPEDQVVGFYAAKLDNNNQFLNNGFKAYLPAPVANAAFLRFDFGTETAIESIEGAETPANAAIYDLSGRRVQGAQKGLYIVNGKKVIK